MTDNTPSALAVDAANLHMSFGSEARPISVLQALNLQIKTGSFTAIMGASGSGKSTLLHLLAGLATPDAGTINVSGQDLSTMKDGALTRFRRRHIGVVFQACNLIPSLTVEENIMLPIRLDRRHVSSQTLKPLIDRLGLGDRLSHLPQTLSGGEQQRVALARALITHPAILLADEPTGNLDAVNTRELGELFQCLNREDGATILLVTHDPYVAAWADIIHILHNGRIVDALERKEHVDADAISHHYLAVMEANRQEVPT